jgi:hypothetical protein
MNIYRRRYPISAHTGRHVVVPGLERLFDLGGFLPPNGPYDYHVTGLVTSQLDIGFAFSLDFPGSFTGNLNSNMRFYLLDLMATLPEMPAEKDQKFGLVYGLGVRIGIAATKVEAKAAASISGVAARAELGVETANYTFVAPGMGPEALGQAGEFFATAGGSFNAGKVESLGLGLEVISQYLINEAKNRTPQPVYVAAEAPKTDVVRMQAISTTWAINRIKQGFSYDEAAKSLPQDDPRSGLVNEIEVQALYRKIVNDVGNQKPSEPQKNLAERIRNMKGPFA